MTNDITCTRGCVSRKSASKPRCSPLSTVAGELGAAGAEQDVRGFALKFYTEEGNWDMVGSNTPVFLRDPYKFPDFIRRKAASRTTRSNTACGFWSLAESRQVTILFSDGGLPQATLMNGYGSHTYSFINAKNERYWVKFTSRRCRATSLDQRRGGKSSAARGNRRKTCSTPSNRAAIRKRFCIKIMTEEQAEQVPFNPFDLTKVWPHKDFPLIEVGILELNRNPDNYFTEIEMAAFSPSNGAGHIVQPGQDAGPVSSRAGAHRYRLGTHYKRCPSII